MGTAGRYKPSVVALGTPDGAVTLKRVPFQATSFATLQTKKSRGPTPCSAMCGRSTRTDQGLSWHHLRDGTSTCVASSLAVTGAIVVTFFSSAD